METRKNDSAERGWRNDGGSRGRAGENETERRSQEDGTLQRILARLAREVGEDRYQRYFRERARVTMQGRGLRVTVPAPDVAELIDRRFGSALRAAAANVLGAGAFQLEFRVDDDAFGNRPAGEPARRLAEPIRRSAGAAPARFRLADFVVGASNQLAYNSAVQIAESRDPGRLSPLFIHGPCGVGKTHLLQGAARRFQELHPTAVVRCVTGESFTNDYITAVRSGKLDAFRASYRSVDLFCLDDVHFLANKEGTQSELLHTFDAIDLGGARVVLASDEHPRDISRLSTQLVSRFLSGMVARVELPDAEMRVRLVSALAARRGLKLDEAGAAFIARAEPRRSEAGSGSVRELEGLLTQVEAVSKHLPEVKRSLEQSGGRIGLVAARIALQMQEQGSTEGRANAARPSRPVALSAIPQAVCRALRVDFGEYCGTGRHKRVVLARAVTVHVARAMTTASYPEIARAMGRPNHSTVITAHQRLAKVLKETPDEDLGVVHGPEFSGVTVSGLIAQLTRDLSRDPG